MATHARRRLRSLMIAAACVLTAVVGVPTAAASAAPDRPGCGRSAVGTEAESALLSRVIGPAARQVCFQVTPAGGPETFSIHGVPGRIEIRASSLSAASEGAGWYLKYVVHADEGLGDFHPKVPHVLPAPPEAITQSSNAANRYEGNDTQDGYTNPYMSWAEWQNLLDMYALHGINQVYVLPGTDAVYEKVLEDYGYTADQARAWIPLSGTQPWWVMQNLSNDTAPIPQSLLDADAALASKIVERCKQLGITPVIPGYFGTVPTDFAAKNSTADNGNPPYVVPQGTWGGAQRPSWLAPTDPLFPKVAADYYKQADTLFGGSTMYRMNPLQEGGNAGNIDPGAAAGAIMTALQAGEPGATWMQLGWQANPRSSELNGLTPAQLSHLLIADGTTDTGSSMPNRDADWPNTNWLFGTIPFGGGQTAMGGNGQVWLDRYFAELAKGGGHMTGIAFQPEGVNDPAAFELFAEMPWHATEFDLDTWLSRYALGRYGTNQASAAWSAIAKAYARPVKCCGQESPLGRTPSLTDSTAPNFDVQTFATALPLLTPAARSATQTAAFDYDLADVANQVVTDWANAELPQIGNAYQAKDLTKFNALTQTWLQAMDLDDHVLGTVPAFMLGTYVRDALVAGDDPTESAALRSNLLHLWTTWFSDSGSSAGNGDLQNYAAHVYSGMVNSYYVPNWQLYFNTLSTALADNTAPAPIDWLTRGDQFASASTPFPTRPTGSTVAFAKQLTTLLSIAPITSPKITSPVNGSALATSLPTVTGTGVSGATVNVTENNALICSATVTAGGSWLCTPSAPLSTGSHTLSAIQSNSAGQSSNATTVSFSVGTAPSLVDDWTFDSQANGVIQDTGSSHFNGTVTGTTTLVPGRVGDAAKFDGTASPIVTSAPNLQTPWAVGAWVNPSARSGSANLLDGPRVQGDSSLKIQQNGTSGLVGATSFYVEDYSVDYAAPLNTWTYLTYVDDGSQITVYANGTAVGAIPASFALSRADIGSNQSNAGLDAYTGLIDQMSVFANSLTPGQVAALYKSAQSGGTGTGSTGTGTGTGTDTGTGTGAVR
ncbi:alpha-N-acetylglucosaminidase C-terminal domain-containing protein [Catenulispora sp. NL8]|uniref:Alpha-N-acetylglucosaminidase C-terminal domain-containing protein n=1 Tax=Catenulispora pinistramenti TaxID=2705254 RepID=A0ABS5KSG1_9ACTN|nr:alpha-N-acetylglucosaminidase TIM-barrel domain-containing protein [Catenulispora pinistramenti]MBS2548986.1 alpha-N-acetylglucosaminidase C-terminal domain-containing protein [Catenulispora pinistramenti]